MLTVLSTLGPHRLDAGRYIVASRFRCRSFDRRYVVGALSTGRCLPAVAPRVLIMGDEVRSRSLSPDNHFHRFQVTAPRMIQQSCRPRVSDRTMVGNYATRLACEFQRTERRRHDEHETPTGRKKHGGPVAPRLTGPLRDRAERSSS